MPEELRVGGPLDQGWGRNMDRIRMSSEIGAYYDSPIGHAALLTGGLDLEMVAPLVFDGLHY